MRRATWLMAILLTASPLMASSPATTQGEIGLGKKLRLGAVSVRPLSIVEDSRCSEGAKCGKANRIVVRTEVRGPSSTKTRDFEIGQTREVEGVGGLMLAAVSPRPLADAAVAPADYRFVYQLSQ